MCDLFYQQQKAIEVCSSLDRYRLLKFSPLKINCRCPVCGDSEKSKIKARFWVNEKDNTLLVGCFNCNYHSNFISFCKDYYPEIFKEMMFNKYKNTSNQSSISVEDLNKNKSTLKVTEKSRLELIVKKHSTCVLDLPKEHPIVKYIVSRKIPESAYNYFYFTKSWQHLVHEFQEESYKNPIPENRLVMLIKDFDGKVTSIQGRSLEDNPRNKYITIKESQDSNKIFGLDKVNLDETVFVTEGIVDSLFLDNAIAITGGSLSFSDIPIPKDKRVFVWDNEPYAEHTVQRIEAAINANEQIVLFDKTNWTSKDINDLITKENISKREVNNYLKENIISNLQAKLRFSKWRKV